MAAAVLCVCVADAEQKSLHNFQLEVKLAPLTKLCVVVNFRKMWNNFNIRL
jgi:hypothetical protein